MSLQRKTPLKAKTPLKTYKPLKAKTPLKQKSNLKSNTTLKCNQKTAKKTKGSYHSIFSDDLSICYITGSKGAVPHHVFGSSRKALSEKYGFILPLRSDWHTVTSYSIHQDKELDLKYKRICEEYYLNHYGTIEDFIKEFGKNYLEKAA